MKSANKNDLLINSLLELINNKKELNRISWDNLGNLIGYSGVGLKKAMKNKTLSLSQIEVIILEMELYKEAEKLGMKISDRKLTSPNSKNNKHDIHNFLKKDKILTKEKDIELLESMCKANWSALMKREDFKDKIRLTSMKDIDKILDERLAIILKKMKS